MRTPVTARGIVAALGLGLGLGACMGKDGDKEREPAHYAAADDSFRLEFSDPPWRVVKESERALRLQVDTEVFGFNLGKAVPPMHILIASPVRLDEHLKDLIDPAQLSEILEQAGVPKDQIPTNFDTIDTNALATLSTANFTTFLDEGSSFPDTGTTGTSGASEPRQKDESTQAQSGETGDTGSGETSQDQSSTEPGKEQDVTIPSVPEYLQGVDLNNARDVAVAELNFLVREHEARIVDGLQHFTTGEGLGGVTYQLAMSPGIFVRNLYLPAKNFTLRVGVMSLFELGNEDIHRLFLSVKTDVVVKVKEDAGKDAR